MKPNPPRRASARNLKFANALRAAVLGLLLTGASSALAENPRVEFKTTVGSFTLELYPDKAPKTVENFLQYASSGFYKGTIFHRVIDGFMIQGGGFDPEMRQKTTRAPIANEAGMAIKGGLRNETGTIAMARTSNPDSATAQFFINVKDNAFLDYREPTPQGIGYAVFLPRRPGNGRRDADRQGADHVDGNVSERSAEAGHHRVGHRQGRQIES
jgi:cyclophilin family peptidyl-prolyl cis-trans isomerase